MNINEMLRENVGARPEQIALIGGRERVSYRELEQRAQRVGAFFQARGVGARQRALLMVPLSVEFYALFLGLTRIGVTVVLIDPAVGSRQMDQSCQIVQPDLFIGSPKAHLLRLTNRAIAAIPRKFVLHGWLPGSERVQLTTAPADRIDVVTDPEDPALITFTSGSTGLPKAICRTHGFLYNQHNAVCNTLPAQASDVELNTLPVFILSSLARGIKTVIPEGFGRNPDMMKMERVVAQIREHGVNRLLAAPAFCKAITEHLRRNSQTLPQISQIYTGGGPVFPALLNALAERMPNATVTAVYGSTEAEPIAHVNLAEFYPDDLAAMQQGKGLLAGSPVPEIHLAILPDRDGFAIGPFTQAEFEQYKLLANQIGEIVVSGEHVQKRYLNGDGGTTKFSVEGEIWHRTGDAGYLDARGRLWLLGRCSARLISQGAMLYPFGVEAAAMAQADVERAAFVQVNGKNVLALELHGNTGSTPAEELKCMLPQVDRVRIVDKIPVDSRHHSKVLYGELRAQLSTF